MPGSPPRPLQAASAGREVLGGAWVPAGAPASHLAPKGQEAGPEEVFLPPAPDRPRTGVSGREGWGGERAPAPKSLNIQNVGVSSVSNVSLNVSGTPLCVSSMGVSNTPAVCLQAVLGVAGDFQCACSQHTFSHYHVLVSAAFLVCVSAVHSGVRSGLCPDTRDSASLCVQVVHIPGRVV